MTLALLAAAEAVETARRDRLRARLRRAGATEIVEPGTAAELSTLLRNGDGPVLIVAADLVAHDAVLWHLATEPGDRSTALVRNGDGPHPVQVDGDGLRPAQTDGDGLRPVGDGGGHGLRLTQARGVITGVAATGPVVFLGAVRVAGRDRQRAAAAAELIGHGDDLVDGLVGSWLRAGARLHAYPLRLLIARRCRTGEAATRAETEIAGVDEERARLRLAVKERDDFVATFLVSSWSPVLTRICARLGLTPGGVTALSVVCALGAALGFAQASRPAMIAGAVLLYLGFVLDCVDGQVARFTRRFTPLGGWLDTMADRAKEYVVYAGLAAGAVRLGHDEGWWLAVAAMTLQTVRHTTDHWYGVLHDAAVPSGPVPGGRLAQPPSPALTRTGGALGRLSDRVIADGRSPLYWLKRIVVFPIGERWALIAVLAAFAGGRVALLAVLGWGVAALAYTLTFRGLRSLAMRRSVSATGDACRQRDDGPLARRLPALAGRLDWLVPAALRLIEYAALIGAAVLHRVPPQLAFVLLLAVAMHHYDLAARPGSRWSPRLEPGWDGRALVAVVFGGVAFPVVAVWTLGVLSWRVVTTRTRQARLPAQGGSARDAERAFAAGRQAR
ncbi:CDP-alcohol phosphatidyltransferase family protein [Catenuloplanes sp. NPDC051500]|uniref:CDP-alcohol phosphatidyltransferase family protein n=1 Tax=Catenuloplanes sp. NPDC051500 TaxID=3363959 RepID=UPI00378E3FBA